MSQQTQLARFRPAVLAITGLAAACGAYVLYTTYSKLQTPLKSSAANGPLRRRGAVHRGRSNRPTLKIDLLPPGEDERSELGYLMCVVDSRNVTYPVSLEAFPNAEIVRDDLGHNFDDSNLQQRIHVAKAEGILQACFLATTDQQRRNFSHVELRLLAEHITSHAAEDITDATVRILQGIMKDPIEQSEIYEALERFLRSDIVANPPHNVDRGPDVQQDATITETEEIHGGYSGPDEPSQGLKGLLYHIARADANRKAYEHRGIHCDECGESPLRGIRWHCMNCPDWDLCSTCEANTRHAQTHIFAKIRIPFPVLSRLPRSQPSWYTGDPRELHDPLEPDVRKAAQTVHGFDAPQIDALYDQFCCFANVKHTVDGMDVGYAINREGFFRACYPRLRDEQSFFRPNAVYDRMFAFYDTDNNGVISFEEFLSGMAYLRGPKRFASLTRALRGYDMDCDGYVDRRDFLRLFRAKHEIQKLLVHKMVEAQGVQYTQEGMERLWSSQPISSIFADEEIPRGGRRARTGKRMDQNGDLQPQSGIRTILEDDEAWPSSEERRRLRRQGRRPSHERLQDRLSAFGEILSEDGTSPSSEVPNGTDEDIVSTASREVSDREGLSHAAVEDSNDPPLDQDVLWEILEEAFQEMLAPLFGDREREENEVEFSRPDRLEWSKEVEERIAKVEQEECVKRDLANGAERDPLVATAMSAYNNPSPLRPARHEGSNLTLSAGMMVPVPTDATSLTRREVEISQRPLDDLLRASGYGIAGIDGTCSPPALNGHPRSPGLHSPQDVPSSDAATSKDPTMPQNRPNGPSSADEAVSTVTKPPDVADNPRRKPFRGDIDTLVRHHQLEQQMKARGGPGRLSYDEVENLVKADGTGELKGLVINWLDWASF